MRLQKVSERRINNRICSEFTLLGGYPYLKFNCHKTNCSMVLPSLVRNPEIRQGQNVLSKPRHKWCRTIDAINLSAQTLFCLSTPLLASLLPQSIIRSHALLQCSGCVAVDNQYRIHSIGWEQRGIGFCSEEEFTGICPHDWPRIQNKTPRICFEPTFSYQSL